MPHVITIMGKELKGYFLTLFGWLLLAFISLMQGLSLSSALKGFQDTPVRETLVYVTFHTPTFWFTFLFIFPLITMKLFAEEEKTGTLETLLTAPLRTWQLVIGKFLAAYLFFLTLLIPAALHFTLFNVLTDIRAPFTLGGLTGAFLILSLMGAMFTALGGLSSAITSSPFVSGIITISILLFLYFLGYVPIIWGDNFAAASLFHYLSCQEHLHYFCQGLIDTRPISYYLCGTLLILLLTIHLIDYRRWRN